MLSQRQALELLHRLPVLNRFSLQFLRYLIVGGIGFVIDVGGLEIFLRLGLSVYTARLCSMAIAIASTYLMHRAFTFMDAAKPRRTAGQFAAFVACQCGAAVLNYGIFCAIIAFLLQPPPFLGRMFALCCGVGAGLIANYSLLRQFVFPLEQQEMKLKPLRLALYIFAGFYSLWLALQRQMEVLAWPNVGHDLGPNDTDVWLRLTQVRQWLTDGSFFDHEVRHTNAPFGGIDIHWTRPMDLLLGFFTRVMPPQLALDMKLLLAAAWVPAVLGLGALALLVQAVRRRFDHTQSLCCLFLLLATGPFAAYYTPGDSDHHGLLAMLWCGVICILMYENLAPRAALLAGALLGLMFWINIEAIMPIALVIGILGVFTLRRAEEMRQLSLLTLGIAAVSIIGLMVEMPPEKYFSFLAMDTLSIIYVVLFSLIAAGSCLLNMPWVRGLPALQRALAAIIVAGAVVLVEAFFYPKFLKGPLADADPYIVHDFFKIVTESIPIYKQPGAVMLQLLWQPALAFALLLFVVLKRGGGKKRRQAILLLALILGTFAMMLGQGRWTYYAQPVALVALASYLPALARRGLAFVRGLEGPLRPAAAIGGLYLVVAVLGSAMSFDNTGSDLWVCQSQMRFAVQSLELQPLLGGQSFVMYAPPEIGGDIQFFTPYRIIAGEYHREGRGMRDLAEITAAPTPGAARALLQKRQVDAVFVCPAIAPETSWLRHIDSAPPSWLKPVGGLRFMDVPGPHPALFIIQR